MRILNRIAIAAVLALFVAAAVTPALASCGGAPLISTTNFEAQKTFIWNGGVFTPQYNGYPNYAPYMYPGNPPVTAAFDAVFWALGTGNPAITLGDDNGAWTWNNGSSPWFFYYSLPSYSFFESAQIFTSWGAAAVIDGCLFNSGPTGGADPGAECTCALLTDQDGTTGYYAILGNYTDGTSDSYFTQPGADGNGNAGPIIMAPIPAPAVTGSAWDPATGDIQLTVAVGGNPGNYLLGGCECGPVGYRVVQYQTGRGLPSPVDRDVAAWAPVDLPGGGAQPITPMGGQVTVESICGNTSDVDVYLATELYFDSTYTSTVVSANSTKVECGSTLAEPIQARPRVRPGTAPELRSPKRTR